LTRLQPFSKKKRGGGSFTPLQPRRKKIPQDGGGRLQRLTVSKTKNRRNLPKAMVEAGRQGCTFWEEKIGPERQKKKTFER